MKRRLSAFVKRNKTFSVLVGVCLLVLLVYPFFGGGKRGNDVSEKTPLKFAKAGLPFPVDTDSPLYDKLELVFKDIEGGEESDRALFLEQKGFPFPIPDLTGWGGEGSFVLSPPKSFTSFCPDGIEYQEANLLFNIPVVGSDGETRDEIDVLRAFQDFYNLIVVGQWGFKAETEDEVLPGPVSREVKEALHLNYDYYCFSYFVKERQGSGFSILMEGRAKKTSLMKGAYLFEDVIQVDLTISCREIQYGNKEE